MVAHISLPVLEEKRPARSRSRSRRRHRSFFIVAAATAIIYILYRYRAIETYAGAWRPSRPSKSEVAPRPSTATTTALVPLEAHIMSKCPDAKDCLRDLVLPTMMRVNAKVDFTLSFIGTPTDSNDGVDCKHGPRECMGNIIELCAHHLYPDPKIYLGFVMCMTRDYKDIPQRELVEDCALEHAIDFEKLNDCATQDDGAFGVSLLRESVKRTSAANVTKSCTVRLDEKIYCIRDNGEWKDCPNGSGVNDLVIAVEKLYGRS